MGFNRAISFLFLIFSLSSQRSCCNNSLFVSSFQYGLRISTIHLQSRRSSHSITSTTTTTTTVLIQNSKSNMSHNLDNDNNDELLSSKKKKKKPSTAVLIEQLSKK